MTKITRIDLFKQPSGEVFVREYAEGWTASSHPVDMHTSVETFETCLAWLRSNGWHIRAWHNGARAWKDEIMPVRTTADIWRKRRYYERYPDPNISMVNIDFAYDL